MYTGQSDPRKMLAQQLMSQGSRGGPVDNPYESINRIWQTYLGAKMQRGLMGEDQASRKAIVDALTGQPEVVPFTSENPGPVLAQDAVAPDQNKALGLMLQSNDPSMQKTAMSGLFGGGGQSPSSVQEYQYWNNLSPEEKEDFLRVKRAQKFLDVGTGYVAPSMTNPQQTAPVVDRGLKPSEQVGYKSDVRSAEKTAELEAKKMDAKPKAFSAVRSFKSKMGLVRGKIDEAKKLVGPFTTGTGALLANLPGTDARRLKGITNTILANMGFTELQEMRANSPTGGALGQVSERELALLTSAKESLDQAQSDKDVIFALNNLINIIDNMESNVVKAFEDDYREKIAGDKPTADTNNDPLGIR